MKFSQNGSIVQSEVVSQKTEDRMLPLLKQLIEIFEATDVVSVQVDQHLLSAELHSFVDLGIFLPGQVYSQERQVDIVLPFSQHADYFV